MAICGLIEDFGLVGFETLAVEVRAPASQIKRRRTLTTEFTGQAVNVEPHSRHRPRDGLRLRSPGGRANARGCLGQPVRGELGPAQRVRAHVERDGPARRAARRCQGRAGTVGRCPRGVGRVREDAVAPRGRCAAPGSDGGGETAEA